MTDMSKQYGPVVKFDFGEYITGARIKLKLHLSLYRRVKRVGLL